MAINIDTTQFPFMDKSGGAERRHGVGTGPNPYVTNGEVVDPTADLKMGTVWTFIADPATNGTPVILLVKYDYANNKLLWFDMAGVQIANGVDLSGYTYRFEVTGK